MNRKSTNNNQKSNNNNSRFSFVNNELQKDKAKTNDKVTSDKAVKDKAVNEKVINENMFKQKETNSRFNLDRLMEEPASTYTPPPPPNPMRNYSFIAASKPQQVTPPPKQQINIQQSDFPTLSSSQNLKTEVKKNDFPTLSSSSQNLKPADEPAKINFKNAITTTNPEVIEEKKFVPKPGMAYIITDKAGKNKLIYGPKTIEQQRNEYRENSMNYQMYLAISRMEVRWAEEKRRYNSIHGENAFQSKYGISSNNNSDEDDYDYDSDNDSNDDSEYETE